MTVTAYSGGHSIVWDGSCWRYSDGEPDGSRPCAHCGINEVMMKVTILAHLSRDGHQHQAVKGVDACIASIVRALNDGGVMTTSSCCGHGRGDGSVLLADGREIIIRNGGANNPLSAPSIAGGQKMETTLTDEELAALLDMAVERVRADLGDGKPLRLKENTNGSTIENDGLTYGAHATCDGGA